MKPWKIIVPLVMVALLAVAFFWGDGSTSPNETQTQPTVETTVEETQEEPQVETQELETTPEVAPEPETEPETTPEVTPEPEVEPETTPEVTPEPEVEPETTPEVAPEPEVQPETTPEVTPEPEPTPEETPAPELTCTLVIRCDTLLNNLDSLPSEKADLVPADGLIFYGEGIVFTQGETVFDVLLRETKNNKIHMEYSNTPIYNSAYIEGIANLYEFDGGPLSGWMYKVNNWFPNYGCGRYALSNGDVIEFVFTCDLGADVGGADAAGQQNEG